jgi:SAM-dependent methyltransferase
MLFERLSGISRRKKLETFRELVCPSAQDTILDLGSEIALNDSHRLACFLDQYPFREQVTAANLCESPIERIKAKYPEVDAVVADARKLPWPDKHFDVVYSNAVIEHVGDEADQRAMASEVMRVGKRWFVTTPNRWYPFEFHLRLPLVTWLPFHGYRHAGRLCRYDHDKHHYVFGMPVGESLRLLGASDMVSLFPHSQIIRQSVTGIAEVLIAVGGALPERQASSLDWSDRHSAVDREGARSH